MDPNVIINAAIERAAQSDFEYGVDDCCLWVCDLVAELTGVDLADPLRGYRSQFGAARKLKSYAGGGLCEAAIKLANAAGLRPAGRPYQGVLVGVVADVNGPALALFYRGRWIGRTIRGVSVLPPHSATVAWKLPPCHF